MGIQVCYKLIIYEYITMFKHIKAVKQQTAFIIINYIYHTERLAILIKTKLNAIRSIIEYNFNVQK